jgi:hypothetical protein
MNIYTVRDNLKKTIAGKEQYLAQMKQDIVKYNQTVNYTVAKYLEVNLEELRNILNDVEKCCEQAIAQSWVGVDRQGGI